MKKENQPVYIFIVAIISVIGALVFNLLSDYAATAEFGRLFRHLSTIAIVFGAGLLLVNWARQ